MTLAEIEKEAERVHSIVSAIARQSFAAGFNDGIEKAAEIVANQDRVKAENMMALQNNAVREIRALKMGGGE